MRMRGVWYDVGDDFDEDTGVEHHGGDGGGHACFESCHAGVDQHGALLVNTETGQSVVAGGEATLLEIGAAG